MIGAVIGIRAKGSPHGAAPEILSGGPARPAAVPRLRQRPQRRPNGGLDNTLDGDTASPAEM